MEIAGCARLLRVGRSICGQKPRSCSELGCWAARGWDLGADAVDQQADAVSSLSLILASQHEQRQRNRAMALWGVTAVSSGAIGVVLGGLLTEMLSWRWVLFVNVPIGVALSVAVAICMLPARPVDGRGRLDLPGTVTVTAGLALLIYGISRATESGWGSAGVIGSLIAAAVLLAGFVAIEATSTQPLVRLDIFRLPNLRIANLLALGLGTCMTGPLFYLSLYLQQLLGYSALRAALPTEVFLEVPTEQDIRPLPVPVNVQVHWLPRTGGADRPGRLALDTVTAARLPAGRFSVFVAGERALPTRLRSHLLAERGARKADLTVFGYWRHGRSSPG